MCFGGSHVAVLAFDCGSACSQRFCAADRQRGNRTDVAEIRISDDNVKQIDIAVVCDGITPGYGITGWDIASVLSVRSFIENKAGRNTEIAAGITCRYGKTRRIETAAVPVFE
jgi:hypothetical protein